MSTAAIRRDLEEARSFTRRQQLLKELWRIEQAERQQAERQQAERQQAERQRAERQRAERQQAALATAPAPSCSDSFDTMVMAADVEPH